MGKETQEQKARRIAYEQYGDIIEVAKRYPRETDAPINEPRKQRKDVVKLNTLMNLTISQKPTTESDEPKILFEGKKKGKGPVMIDHLLTTEGHWALNEELFAVAFPGEGYVQGSVQGTAAWFNNSMRRKLNDQAIFEVVLDENDNVVGERLNEDLIYEISDAEN